MPVYELPDDIIGYIKKLKVKLELDEEFKKIRKFLYEICEDDIRAYDNIYEFMDENVDFKNILTLNDNFDEYINNSYIDIDYMKEFIDVKKLKKMYKIDCKMKELQKKGCISFKEFKDKLYTLVYEFYIKLLYKSFMFLHEYKTKISGFLNEDYNDSEEEDYNEDDDDYSEDNDYNYDEKTKDKIDSIIDYFYNTSHCKMNNQVYNKFAKYLQRSG